MKITLKSIFLLFLFCLFLIDCSNEVQKQTSFLSIDFEQCLKNEKTIKISEIADTVEYLKLKTPKDIIISRIGDVYSTDEYWIIRSISGVSLFTKNGDWVRQIGKKGQGPGEYIQIRGVDFNPATQEILIADAQQILFYDLEGNFLRNVKMVEDYYFNIAISDTVLWTTGLGIHIEKYQVYSFNCKRDTLSAFPNPHYGMQVKNSDGVYFSHTRWEKEFYRNKNGLYLKQKPAHDTVYWLSGSKRIPHIAFNMGKYKLPIEYEYWFSTNDHDRYGSSYWGISSLVEDDRYLFLLSLRRTSLSRTQRLEDDFRYIVYDKKTESGFSAKGKEGSQIIDDILGGPTIWPRFMTDDYYIWTIEWYEILDGVREGVYNLSPALKKQFDSFDYGTNELLILAKKRKNKKKK